MQTHDPDKALRILERWIGKGAAYDELRYVHSVIQALQQRVLFQRERAQELSDELRRRGCR